jgi:hypothetical protein
MRILIPFLLVMSFVLPGLSATHPQPVATLDLNQFFPLFPPGPTKKPHGAHIAFLPDSTIATTVCKSGDCLLVLAKWDGGTLRPFGQPHEFFKQSVIYQTAQGSLVTFREWDDWHAPYLHSPDPFARTDPPSLQKSSQSGNTVAEQKTGGWDLYHLDPKADPRVELIRQATGNLEALSDGVAVFHDHAGIRAETLQGKVLGSFKAKGYRGVALGNGNRLLLRDGQGFRVVDFSGVEHCKLRVPRESGPYVFVALSDDGKRVLSDTFSRTAFAPVGWANIAYATVALASGADWAPTRERVQVMDTVSGASCFDLHRSFMEGSENGSHNAAISSSGEFLAVAGGGVLSVYRLPAVCGAKK